MEGEGEKTGTGSTKSRLQHLLEKASQMQPEDMLFRYHGLLYPSTLCSEESLRLYAKFEARPEDMCIASYPKCGFNWVYALFCGIATAVQGKAEEEKNNMAKKITLLEFSDAEGYEMMKSCPSPRVYGTHCHYENLPPSIIEKKAKVLVVFRNPKDVAVSYYHFCQNNPLLPNPTSWDDFFKQYMMGEVAWGSYFDSALIWEKHIDDEDVMVITYEELKENLPGGVQKIADFFGHSLTEEQIQNIARKGTFQAMNDNSKETHSVLGKVFFRKGVIGDWKTLFTEEQSQEMDAKFVECLAGTKLAAKLNYNLYCKT
ncbi:sulfotransferase 6B1 isoform X1 [Narcine bancroftii]|uniref:sulfotransferase 6B1 isoform X1 n=1 Tax=Narcine bancroftii TaxID=1343680 RepID=UPI0038318383